MNSNNNYEELISELYNIKPSFNNVFGKTITGLTNSGSLPSTDVINNLNENTGKLVAAIDPDNVVNRKTIVKEIEGDLRLLVTLNEIDSSIAEKLITKLHSI